MIEMVLEVGLSRLRRLRGALSFAPPTDVAQGSMSWSVVRLCGVLFGDMGSQAACASVEFPPAEDNAGVSDQRKFRRETPSYGK